MKNITSIMQKMVTVFLLAMVLTSCSSDSILDPKEPVEISVWHYYNGSQLIAFENMVSEFNQTLGKELGIQVKSVNQGGVNDLAQLVLDIASGSAGAGGLPDAFAAYPDTAYELMEMGLTADLRNYLTEEDIAEFVDSFFEEGQLPPDDVATIFPMAKSTELLLIDALAWEEVKDQINTKAGTEQIKDADLATWEGITRACQLYYEYTDNLTPDIKGDGKALFGIDSAANYLYVTMRQQGVTFLSNDGGKGKMTIDEIALKKAFDIYYESIVRGWFAHVGRYRSDDVKTGEIIGFIGSSSSSSYFPDVITYSDGTKKEADLASFKMPTFEGEKNVAIQQGAGMVVTNSDEKHEYAAVTFLKWMTQQEQNLRLSIDSAYIPVTKEALYGENMAAILSDMATSNEPGLFYTAKVYETVLEQLETHELYYAEPFPGLFETRMVIESIADFSNEARATVLELIDRGMDYEDAVDQVLSMDSFNEWLDYLVENTKDYLG